MEKIKCCCIIDDDPISVFGIKKSIMEIDFCETIIVYKNGQEAINGLKAMIKNGTSLPCIILLDLNMPVMDGWEFLDDFNKITVGIINQVMVYIITSSIDPRDMLKSKEYHLVSKYIPKPIGSKALRDVLNDIKSN